MARLQEEVDRVMSHTSAETFYQDLNSMHYLEQVTQETLRMHPVAVATTRTNYADATLGKTVIPAGSTIMVNIVTLFSYPCWFNHYGKYCNTVFL